MSEEKPYCTFGSSDDDKDSMSFWRKFTIVASSASIAVGGAAVLGITSPFEFMLTGAAFGMAAYLAIWTLDL